MKYILFAILLFCTNTLPAQHVIDDRLIFSKKDTIICLPEKSKDSNSVFCEKIVICRNKNLQIIRIDKVFENREEFAYAYFKNGRFQLMQWNNIHKNEIIETKTETIMARNRDIILFYMAIGSLPGLSFR